MSDRGQVNTQGAGSVIQAKLIPQHISGMQRSLDELHDLAASLENMCQRLTGSHPPSDPKPPSPAADRPMSMPELLTAIYSSFADARARISKALVQMENAI